MRIAYCVNGELRTFFNHYKKLQYFKDEMADMGVFIDFYGHTWSHSYVSELESVDFFERIVYTDQVEIDNWIKEDFVNRVATNWYSDDKGMTTPDEYVSKMLMYSRRMYGQLIGGHHALCLPDDTYDLYIRSRWDALPKDTLEHGALERACQAKESMELFVNFNYSKLIPDFSKVEFNDTFFALTPALWKQTTSVSIYDTLHEMMFNTRRGDGPLQAHDAWREYFASFRNVIAHQLYLAPVGLMRD